MKTEQLDKEMEDNTVELLNHAIYHAEMASKLISGYSNGCIALPQYLIDKLIGYIRRNHFTDQLPTNTSPIKWKNFRVFPGYENKIVIYNATYPLTLRKDEIFIYDIP